MLFSISSAMRRFVMALGASALLFSAVVPVRTVDAAVDAKPMYAEPALSPDGSEIAFVSGGDIWTVPATGGTARLLVSFGATESRPMYSPDGKKLAFISTRTGNGDIYVLTLDGGDLKRVTFDDSNDQLENWSPDGKWLYFSTSAHNVGYDADIERVAAEGGTPLPFINDPYANQYGAAPSPDGATIAYVADGFGQWWRRGHAHIDETSLALYRPATNRYERLTSGAKEQYPMWSPDGSTLYFVSDRSGADNVWAMPLGGKPRRLTTYSAGRIVWPTIARRGHTIAYERDFAIHTFDLTTGTDSTLEIVRRGLPARLATDHITQSSRFLGLAIAPDGRKLALTARGQIFAAGAKEGGDAQRVTRTHANETGAVWSPNGRTIAYTSDRSSHTRVYTYDFASQAETEITHGDGHDTSPRFTRDGRALVYIHDARELREVDLATKADHRVVAASFDPAPFLGDGPFALAPAGDAVAYLANDAKGFVNAHVAKLDGSRSTVVSFLPNTNGGSIAFSPDGTRLYFVTGQRTEPGEVVRIDLIPQPRKFREDQFRDLFQEVPSRTQVSPASPAPRPSAGARATPLPASGEPTLATVDPAASASPAAVARHTTEVVTDGLRDRAQVLPVGVDVASLRVSPDGKTLLLNAEAAGQQNLYTFSIDELSQDPAVAHQLTSSLGRKQNETYAGDGAQIYYLENGRVFTAAADGHTPPHPIALAAELDIDFDREKQEVFEQAWDLLDLVYYDPAFHGADWHAVREHYAPYVEGARTPAELRRALNLMVGELNSSHSGVGGPQPTTPRFTTGHLGVRYDAAAYGETGRLRIADVLPLGPMALTRSVRAGDTIVAINGVRLERTTDIDELLDNTIGKRTVVRVATANGERDFPVQPIAAEDERDLRYRQWTEANRAYVDRISGGRIGYVHLRDMGEESLRQFELDLDVLNRAKRGIVVDIRNNNGGFIDPYAIDILARHDYIRFSTRNAPLINERTSLGQRALGLPTVLLVNEHSLSDAENFTEGYRQLHLGRVVGEPTAGWIIFTSSATLVDGSVVRLPAYGTFGTSGDMELHPRPVDVRVERRLGARLATAGDIQLEAAVHSFR